MSTILEELLREEPEAQPADDEQLTNEEGEQPEPETQDPTA